MADLTKTIAAKSDQLNADDLIGGPMTTRILRVEEMNDEKQPTAIHISEWKQPYKPCKTMRRLLCDVWGGNGDDYVGRSFTLFRNPEVKFQGEKVGGIEISHMSGITKPHEVMLTATRGKKKKYVVQPLRDHVAEWRGKMSDCETIDQLKAIGQQLGKSGLSAADLAVLRDYYGVRSKELTATPKPDATDLNAQNEAYSSIERRIMNKPNSAQGAALKEEIIAAVNGGELTQDLADELTEKLRVEMN